MSGSPEPRALPEKPAKEGDSRAALLAVARGAPLEESLGILARALETALSGAMVAFFATDLGGRRLVLAAAPSLPAFYANAVDGLEIGELAESSGAAAFRGRAAICPSIEEDPAWERHRDLAASVGIAAAWAWPLATPSGSSLGVLTCYLREPRPPAPEEEEAALDALPVAAIAIEGSRRSRQLAKYRQRLEGIAAEAQERYRAIFLGSADAVIVMESEGPEAPPRIVDANDLACEWLGLRREELLALEPRAAMALVVGRDPERAARELSETGRSIFEADLRRRDGSLLPVEVSARRAFVGGRTATVAVARSLVERKAAEAELRKLSRALEQSPSAVVITDLAGRIEYVNPAFCRITGYPREEAIGATPRILKSGEHPASYYQALWTTIASGGEWHGEFRNRRKDGSLYWEAASISAIRDETGRIVHYCSVKEDITERKRVEEALRESERAANAANKAKSDFLANMSHEIRTPMNAIIGFSGLALKGEVEPRLRGYLERIRSAGESLLALINDILDVSKIETGKLSLESVLFPFEKILDDASAAIAPKAQEKRLGFYVNLGRGVPPYLVGDPLRLGQILLNLLSNAVKFTEKGRIDLDVELLERESERVRLRFTVRDTGIGVTPEQRERLFKPFSQADGSISRKYGGTGLGLSICARLVELMGGEIGLVSEPGRGSAFGFALWLGTGYARPAARRSGPPILPGLRVLLVEDDPALARATRRMLEWMSCAVEAYATGEAAAAAAQAARDRGEPFSLAILDRRLPGMDGLAVATALRERLGPAYAPAILMVSSYVTESAREALRASGIAEFLQKPLAFETLKEAVLRVLGPRDGAEGGAAAQAGGGPAEAGRDLSALRVLVVDDSEVNLELALALLAERGIRAESAEDGMEAISKISAADPPYDLVLMDVQMPELDGYEATRILRRDPRFRSLPIVAMTAHALKEEVERSRAAGMDEHLTKPIDPELLYDTIARLGRRGGGEGPVPVAPGGDGPEEPSRSGPGAPEAAAADPATPAALCQDELALPAGGSLTIAYAEGLARTGGRADLYAELLERFSARHGGDAEAIESALAGGRPEEAHRIAHRLKGDALTVGARELGARAAAVEEACARRETSGEERVFPDGLGAELAGLRQTLRDSLCEASALASGLRAGGLRAGGLRAGGLRAGDLRAAAGAAEAGEATIERLCALLAAGEAAALDELEAARALLEGRLGAEDAAAAIEAARDYDYERALALLGRQG